MSANRYPTPSVAAVVLDAAGRALLARAEKGPFAGLWLLPGAPLQGGLDWRGALDRVFAAETGLGIREAKLVGIYSDPELHRIGDDHRLVASFLVTPGEGTARPGDGIAALEWFCVEALPAEIWRGDPIKIRDAVAFRGEVFTR